VGHQRRARVVVGSAGGALGSSYAVAHERRHLCAGPDGVTRADYPLLCFGLAAAADRGADWAASTACKAAGRRQEARFERDPGTTPLPCAEAARIHAALPAS